MLGFATDLYDAVIVRMIRMGQPIPSTPFLHADKSLDALRYTIEKCLFGADRKVVAQAKKWGMNFTAVSDLNGRTVLLPICTLVDSFRDHVEAYSGVRNPPRHSLLLSSREQLLQVIK